MAQTFENQAEIEMPLLAGMIAQGDRTSRHVLMGQEGSSLALADDIYSNYFFAEPFRKAMGEAQTHQRQFAEEVRCLFTIVEAWKAKHSDQIWTDKTKILNKILVSSSGKHRFQFVVMSQEGHAETLVDAVESLDESIVNNPDFQIVRLDSIVF